MGGLWSSPSLELSVAHFQVPRVRTDDAQNQVVGMIAEVMRNGQSCQLTGKRGSGKTTMLKKLLADLEKSGGAVEECHMSDVFAYSLGPGESARVPKELMPDYVLIEEWAEPTTLSDVAIAVKGAFGDDATWCYFGQVELLQE